MTAALQILLLILVLASEGAIILLLKKGTLTLKYALVWLLLGLVLLIMVIFPDLFISLSRILGFEVTSNFVFLVEGVFVLVILVSLTVIVSKHAAKLTRLIQTIGILDKRVRELEEILKEKEERSDERQNP
ncbi:MAG: DUF2304 domain-containing protein [Clostridiales bacterium]|nr:DUF2304 domain-containing protein [Clostridiales bacterium]